MNNLKFNDRGRTLPFASAAAYTHFPIDHRPNPAPYLNGGHRAYLRTAAAGNAGAGVYNSPPLFSRPHTMTSQT